VPIALPTPPAGGPGCSSSSQQPLPSIPQVPRFAQPTPHCLHAAAALPTRLPDEVADHVEGQVRRLPAVVPPQPRPRPEPQPEPRAGPATASPPIPAPTSPGAGTVRATSRRLRCPRQQHPQSLRAPAPLHSRTAGAYTAVGIRAGIRGASAARRRPAGTALSSMVGHGLGGATDDRRGPLHVATATVSVAVRRHRGLRPCPCPPRHALRRPSRTRPGRPRHPRPTLPHGAPPR